LAVSATTETRIPPNAIDRLGREKRKAAKQALQAVGRKGPLRHRHALQWQALAIQLPLSGQRKTLAFGKWEDVDLAHARQRRDEARKHLSDGRDPACPEEKSIKNTFETVARDWHAAAKTAWTSRYAKLVLGRLEADIFPHLGADDIDAIEPPRLLEVIRKIEARDAFEMAKRVKNHCSEIFQYGIAEGKCRHDPAAEIHRALKKSRPKQYQGLNFLAYRLVPVAQPIPIQSRVATFVR
jgi:hypothetical protein